MASFRDDDLDSTWPGETTSTEPADDLLVLDDLPTGSIASPSEDTRDSGSAFQRPVKPPARDDSGAEPTLRSIEKPEPTPPPVDRVHFSVTAPPAVAPGEAFVLDVWAHLEAQRDEVLRRARQALQRHDLLLRQQGPTRLTRGTILSVVLRIQGMEVEEPEAPLLWDGEIAAVSFPVSVPAEARLGSRPGRVSFRVDGVEVAKIVFVITVAAAAAPGAERLPVHTAHHRTAFASYASDDRDTVLSVLQGLQKCAPGLDVFLDVASLRSGERWADRLRREIASRDVFYLFWSAPASRSEWVEREWRLALETRGLEFIDPVPLVSPAEVPPPRELGDLHFNDWVLAYKRRG